MSNRLRAGVLGAGPAAWAHGPHLAAHDEIELVAVTDFDAARANAFSDHFGGQVYPSLEEMLAQAALDVLVNCSWTMDHAATTIAAFDAGCKGVLCQRPPAATVDQAKAMTAAARRKGRVLLISLPFRHMQSDAVIQAASRRQLGQIYLAEAAWVVPGDQPPLDAGAKGEGAFGRYVTNGFDLAWWLSGSPKPRQVSGVTADFLGQAYSPRMSVEDTGVCSFDFGNGMRLESHAAWGAMSRGKTEAVLWGSEASLRIPLVAEGADPRACLPEVSRRRFTTLTREVFENPPPLTLPEGYAREIEHLVRCVRGEELPLVSLEEVETLVRMITAFYDSAAQSGAQVAID